MAIIAKFCSSGSIYSMTDSSIRQLVNKSFQASSFVSNLSIISEVIRALLSLTFRTGRVKRPPSLQIRISKSLKSNMTEVYMLIIPRYFLSFISLYNSIGRCVIPNQAPFTNTFTFRFMSTDKAVSIGSING